MPNYFYLLSEINSTFGPVSNCIYILRNAFTKLKGKKTISSFSSTEQGVQKNNAADTHPGQLYTDLPSFRDMDVL